MTIVRHAPFSSRELVVSAALAVCFELALFGLIVEAGKSRTELRQLEEPSPMVVPIAVQPVLDELPLLKLGSAKAKAPRLPDIWEKRAPVPVRRLEERSAPSPLAKDDPEAASETPLADDEHAAPTLEDELVKHADETLTDDEAPSEAAASPTEGAADGVEEGTETDPLKARAVDLYRRKLLTWFNARFRPPTGEIPCEELRTLSAAVTVQVDGERAITAATITAPSGNAVFDARVRATLDALRGQVLPPPPPLYPDIVRQAITPRLSGAGVDCSSAAPAQSPSAPAPSGGETPDPSPPAPG